MSEMRSVLGRVFFVFVTREFSVTKSKGKLYAVRTGAILSSLEQMDKCLC